MSTPAPLVSDSSPYQKPESGKGRRQPGPEPGLVRRLSVRSLDAVTARAIVVVRVRHDSVPFLIDQRIDNGAPI
jgi:hypothetical protein